MTRDSLLVFYDGECGRCSGVMAWALRRDRSRLLRPVPAQSGEALEALGPERARDARDALHAWSRHDGLVTGVDAVAALLDRLPGWRIAARVLAWPPVTAIARPFYRFVARHRHSFGAARCALPLSPPAPAAPPRPSPPRSHRS